MKLKRIILSVFFPERCSICGEIKPFLKSWCPHCGIDAKVISSDACLKCGHEKCICTSNSDNNLTFSAVYYYDGQLKRSLLKFKFNSESSYCDVFSKAMAKRVMDVYSDIAFDGVCYVPMTKTNTRFRGYNQSKLLAQAIADELKLPLMDALVKSKETLSQKNLTQKERLENLKDSFSANDDTDIKGKTLLLCDDIKTTGATLRECCDTLIKAGAKDVLCICLAVTHYKGDNSIF